ncbi:hypothetical protein N9L40_03250 [Rhodobacteraceae bacterium]|nr:hypothetical protein [Paracoccaceae bacterium]
MAQMMNCIKFKPKVGSHDALYTAIAIYLRDYPLPDTVRLSAHDIGDGEHALIGFWDDLEDLADFLSNRIDNRFSDVIKPFVTPYPSGDEFQSFSGPGIDYNAFLESEG